MSDDPKTDMAAKDAAETASAAPPDREYQRIGPYVILEKSGEGGMGTVYIAEQTQPLRRRVALKVIKRGMDSNQVIARFEAERQALALMDHPAIATIYDAGTTPDGRPYFAMEYVQGVPINEHCDRHRLSTNERLGLFLQVCEGVQHAHQKAIIHRDLKPSNVLVTLQDGRAAVKIIDFGLAKALAHSLTDRPLYTEIGVMVGTPEYMSPEQAERTAQGVDGRTDVYSLGVMLYELLVGALPFESKTLRSGGIDDIRRRIREEVPQAPSMRLLTLGDKASTQSSHRRQVDPPTLRRQLRGDLDWITMKALEKDRTRRYESPAALAADIAQHLAGDPVLARPPGAARQVTRFVRRHPTGVGIGMALLATAIGAAISLRLVGGTIDSLAVLPLQNRDADPESEYLSDGMTETIINKVSELPAVTVISSASALHYKNRSVEPREAARQLKVRAVLTGYMQRRGDDLVVSVALVDAQRNRQLWGQRYTTKVSQILEVEEDIASRVSEEMRLKLRGEEKRRLLKQSTESPEAHTAYLKGRHVLVNKWGTKTGAQEAIDWFNRAIAADPDYALAYVGLSDAYYSLSNIHLKPTEVVPRTRAAALKALELDDSLGAAHTALGVIKWSYDWDMEGARREVQRAIDLAPSDAQAHVMLGLSLAGAGHTEQAQVAIQRALELDPLSPFNRAYCALSHYMTRRYAQAESELKSLIAEQPGFEPGHAYLGLVYEQMNRKREAVEELRTASRLDDGTEGLAQLGHAFAVAGEREEAIRVLGELQGMSASRFVNPFSVGLIHAALGDLDQGFTWFDRAVEEHSEWIAMLAIDPRLDGLRDDPRFHALLQRVGMAPVSGSRTTRASPAPPTARCAGTTTRLASG